MDLPPGPAGLRHGARREHIRECELRRRQPVRDHVQERPDGLHEPAGAVEPDDHDGPRHGVALGHSREHRAGVGQAAGLGVHRQQRVPREHVPLRHGDLVKQAPRLQEAASGSGPGVVGEEVVAEVGAGEEAGLDGARVDGAPGARVGGRLAQPQEARVVVAGGGHHCRPRRPRVELQGAISHVAEKVSGLALAGQRAAAHGIQAKRGSLTQSPTFPHKTEGHSSQETEGRQPIILSSSSLARSRTHISQSVIATAPAARKRRKRPREDDGGHDQREPGGARAAGARRAPARRGGGSRRARRLRYGEGHQGPGAPLLAGAAQRALPGVRLRRREARPHPDNLHPNCAALQYGYSDWSVPEA